MKNKIIAVILAAGDSERFGSPKVLQRLCGKPILSYSLEVFEKHKDIDAIILVANKDKEYSHQMIDIAIDCDRMNNPNKIFTTTGGDSRQKSSYAGVKLAKHLEATHILIHDAARPFITSAMIDRIILAFDEGYRAVDTIVPATDTLVKTKQKSNYFVHNEAHSIPNRNHFGYGQTPQGFEIGIIVRAHEWANNHFIFNATDDCTLVEKSCSAPIRIVEGDRHNIKITYPEDLFIAEKILQIRSHGVKSDWIPNNKVIVIFGGLSGIGKEIADILKENNIIYAYGRDVDVYDWRHLIIKFADIYHEAGAINSVIVTAATLTKGELASASRLDIENEIKTNLLGSIQVAKYALPYLRESNGHLVLFTSSAYLRGRPGYATYCATKAGIVSFMQAIAEEEPHVHINAVCPSRTDTKMRKHFEDNEGLLDPKVVAERVCNLLCEDVTGTIVEVRK